MARFVRVTCVIGPGKKTERALLQAFHDGVRSCGSESDVVHWSMCDIDAIARDRRHAIAIAGARRDGTHLVWRDARARGIDVFYLDNGYFLSRWRLPLDKAYFRITLNGFQHTGTGCGDLARLEACGVNVQPWHPVRHDTRVVVALQTDWWYELNGISADSFQSSVIGLARQALPYRKVDFRDKPMTRNQSVALQIEDWENVHCVITYTSGLAVEAILNGVAGYCLGPSACHALIPPSYDLKRCPPVSIEKRRQWAAVLAANQWTIEEISRGDAWKTLNR